MLLFLHAAACNNEITPLDLWMLTETKKSDAIRRGRRKKRKGNNGKESGTQ